MRLLIDEQFPFDLKPLVPEILEAAKKVKPGQVLYVGDADAIGRNGSR
jgi:hypothetical protein